MKSAEQPFQFMTASYLTRIGNQQAANLLELRGALEQCADASIFYHSYQTLDRHHFLREGFSNDFAQWSLASCNRPRLAERLAALDIRDYTALAELRRDLVHVVGEYCQAHPEEAQQTAFEPFYFCEAIEVVVPLGREARTLEEFRQCLESLSHASFHFHFISSRLRPPLRMNDFSHWFASALELERLARQTNSIDIYTNTLESARMRLLALVDEELER